jgi:polyribonucleotide nucleotidyltransferase
MVEGEMKEISEAEMVEAIKFAHGHIKIKFLLKKIGSCFGKEVRTYDGEREDEAIYAKVKKHLTIKIMLLLAKVLLNKNVQQHLTN